MRNPGASDPSVMASSSALVDRVDEVGGGLQLDEMGGHGSVAADSVYRIRSQARARYGVFPIPNSAAQAENVTKAITVDARMIRAIRPLSAP